MERTQVSMPRPAREWISRNLKWCRSSALSSDIELLKQLAYQALDDLSAEFKDVGGLNLLSDLTLEIQVHKGRRPEAAMQTNVRDGRPHAVLEILAPSRYAPGARTMVNEPKDRVYVHKTLVHELSMLFLWQITRRKAVGWEFFCAPDWFVDGWEEYLALTRSSEHTRTVTLSLYRQQVKSKWLSRVAPTINRYLDGPIVLEFMHERFSRGRLFQLLQSNKCTFADALIATLDCDEVVLFESWRQWLAS